MHGAKASRVTLFSRGCFTNVLRALQNNLAKINNTRNHFYDENFKMKLCACAQSMALGAHTMFQLEILIRSMISAIHKFRENILESSRHVSETPPMSATEGLIFLVNIRKCFCQSYRSNNCHYSFWIKNCDILASRSLWLQFRHVIATDCSDENALWNGENNLCGISDCSQGMQWICETHPWAPQGASILVDSGGKPQL